MFLVMVFAIAMSFFSLSENCNVLISFKDNNEYVTYLDDE